MATQEQFQKFLSDIEPSNTTKARAKSAHETLRTFLKNHEVFKDKVRNIFLSGSYKRNTAIRPKTREGEEERPDIDVIVVTSHTLEDDPKEVLKLLYETLSENYDELRLQTRSVGIFTPSVDMDVVPIIEPNAVIGKLYIPDRKLEEWVETNPPRHAEWTTEINDQAGRRFKPLVKLNKWWRRENPTISNKPKGFMLECLVAENMDYGETSYEELFIGTLENIANKYEVYIDTGIVPHLEDPGVLGNNVLSNVTSDAFSGFIKKVRKTADRAREAQNAENDDEELKIWREIFGDRFPQAESASQRGKALRDGIYAGTISFDPEKGRVEFPGNGNSQTNISYHPQRFHSDK